jgi:hypothetical protein
MIDTKELRRLLSEATPVPWIKESAAAVSCGERRPICFLDVARKSSECEANSALIVALRNEASELIDRLARAEALLKRVDEDVLAWHNRSTGEDVEAFLVERKAKAERQAARDARREP